MTDESQCCYYILHNIQIPILNDPCMLCSNVWIVFVGCNWFDTLIDGKPAGKKTTTAPIIADGRSSKCNNCSRILLANRKLYYTYTRRFLAGHPYPVPTITQLECYYISSVQIYLFFFSFGVTLIRAYHYRGFGLFECDWLV